MGFVSSYMLLEDQHYTLRHALDVALEDGDLHRTHPFEILKCASSITLAWQEVMAGRRPHDPEESQISESLKDPRASKENLKEALSRLHGSVNFSEAFQMAINANMSMVANAVLESPDITKRLNKWHIWEWFVDRRRIKTLNTIAKKFNDTSNTIGETPDIKVELVTWNTAQANTDIPTTLENILKIRTSEMRDPLDAVFRVFASYVFITLENMNKENTTAPTKLRHDFGLMRTLGGSSTLIHANHEMYETFDARFFRETMEKFKAEFGPRFRSAYGPAADQTCAVK